MACLVAGLSGRISGPRPRMSRSLVLDVSILLKIVLIIYYRGRETGMEGDTIIIEKRRDGSRRKETET